MNTKHRHPNDIAYSMGYKQGQADAKMDTKHTDSVEAKIQDFSSKFYYPIQQKQAKYEDLVDWLRTTLQATQSQQVEEAVRKERERVMGVLITEGYLKGTELIAHDESKKSHGTCCYCDTCGHDNDYCVCSHNELLQALTPNHQD